MASDLEPAPPSITPWDTSEGERAGGLQVCMQRNSDGASGARPKHGALACRKYGLLVPEGPAGDLAVSGHQGSGYDPKETTGTGGTSRR